MTSKEYEFWTLSRRDKASNDNERSCSSWVERFENTDVRLCVKKQRIDKNIKDTIKQKKTGMETSGMVGPREDYDEIERGVFQKCNETKFLLCFFCNVEPVNWNKRCRGLTVMKMSTFRRTSGVTNECVSKETNGRARLDKIRENGPRRFGLVTRTECKDTETSCKHGRRQKDGKIDRPKTRRSCAVKENRWHSKTL